MLFQFAGGRFGVGFFQTLERWGFMDSIFPFALAFTVTYAVLAKTKIFLKKKGDGSVDPKEKVRANKINLVVSIIMGILFIYPHISGRYRQWGLNDPVDIVNASIPQVGVILVGVLLFMILIGAMGFKGLAGTGLKKIAFLLAFLGVGYIFLDSAGYLNFTRLNFLRDPNMQAFLVILLVLGGLLYFLGSDGQPRQPDEKHPIDKFLTWFSEKPPEGE